MSVKNTLKTVMLRLAPGFTTVLVSIRSRRLQEKWAKTKGRSALAARVAESTSFRCWSGPFKGMQFPSDIVKRHSSPKLLGTYEAELHSYLEPLLHRQYLTAVNIGMAEGYYVVGLALRLPEATIYGFDADPIAKCRTRELAVLNGVGDRVIVAGLANHQHLQEILSRPPSLLMIDCEGCEAEILDPARCSVLAETDIVAELHPNVVPDVESLINERFGRTHDIHLVRSTTRSADQLECLKGFSPSDRMAAVDEYRSTASQPWAIMTVRPGNS